MINQEIIQKLQTLRNTKPSEAWLLKSERELKARMPKAQWPIYSVIFALTLALAGVIYKLPSPESPAEQIKLTQENKQQEEPKQLTQEQTKQEIKTIVKKAKTASKKIEKNIEEKILASKIAPTKNDEIDPRVKLLQDLENAKATTAVLEQIEKDIENGDYVLAREKLNRYLDSLKVEGEKQEIIINQE